MSEEYSILEIDPAWREKQEQLGSKPKFWFKIGKTEWLFKEARHNTGEHWSEKVASEVAAKLGLATHHVELAQYQGKAGAAVRSFLDEDEVLVHGNELLGSFIAGYDTYKHWKQTDHRLDNITSVIEKVFKRDESRRAASLRIIGYLLFDVLVGNTDRHHENWGILLGAKIFADDGGSFRRFKGVARTYDHASSLGRELLTEKRRTLLDEPARFQLYMEKARGAIYDNSDAKKPLTLHSLAATIQERHPDIFKVWKERIQGFTQEDMEEILGKVPGEVMDETAKEFALEFVVRSRKLLLDTR